MALTLYPHQQTVLTAVRQHFNAGRKRVLIQAATGYGKTATTATIVRTAAERGNSSWFVVHRRELVNQVCRAFDREGINYGVIAADYAANLSAPAQIVSVQTVARRLERLKPPKLLVLDEAHHAAGGMWKTLMAWASESYQLGLSATPRRLDGIGLGDFFEEMVCGPSMQWLIDNRFLSPYRYFEPAGVSMEGVQIVAGEFNRRQMAERVTDAKIVGDAVAHYRAHCNGARAVAFCVSVDHAKQVAENFKAAGIPAAYFEGNFDKQLRDQITRDFEAGHIRVLANCELLGEGYDLPAIEAAILLRPTMSLTLYLQQVGRALRFVEGKTAVILDHVGNSARHGYPADEREWSLEIGGRAKKEKSRPSPRICTKCFAASRPRAVTCETCGNPFEVEGREIDTTEGTLAEVDAPPTERQIARKQELREQGRARTFDELVALAKSKYGHGDDKARRWATYVHTSRQKKTAAG